MRHKHVTARRAMLLLSALACLSIQLACTGEPPSNVAARESAQEGPKPAEPPVAEPKQHEAKRDDPPPAPTTFISQKEKQKEKGQKEKVSGTLFNTGKKRERKGVRNLIQ